MAEEDPQAWRMEIQAWRPQMSVEVPRHLVDEGTAQEAWQAGQDLHALYAERRVHMCRCLIVGRSDPDHQPYLSRCPARLPVDQPLCGHCEEMHVGQVDPVFLSGAYVMLVPPECP